MPVPIFQVDAFADRPFSGNPAGVCILPAAADERWMQAVAAEMNLSETAFLVKEGDGFRLRWFTPTTEVALCGHATLASAHVLWSEGYVSADWTIKFHTMSGLLQADRCDDLIELDFPIDRPADAAAPQGLLDALGVSAAYVGRGRIGYLVEVESEDTVRAMSPDFARLAKVEARGVIVTARSDSAPYDFISRFFDPWEGINEDPVTGSAHCCLGPYWQQRLGRDSFTAYQASSRGGVVHVRVDGERALLGGHAVTVLRGELAASDAGSN